MDWSKFFSMGGYAFYVWGSYLAALVLIGGEVALLLKRKKSLGIPDSTATGGDNR
ncbi:MAG: heme exporter protein CcmD [Pyrinomonadaceae bacterium]